MRIALVSEHASPLAALGGEDAGGQNVYVAELATGVRTPASGTIRVAGAETRLLTIARKDRNRPLSLDEARAEAKGRGYDPKAIRKIMSIRKKKREEYQEEEAILEVYMQALGMI